MESEFVDKNIYDINQRRMEERLDNMNAKLNYLTWAVNLLLAVTGIAVSSVIICLAVSH